MAGIAETTSQLGMQELLTGTSLGGCIDPTTGVLSDRFVTLKDLEDYSKKSEKETGGSSILVQPRPTSFSHKRSEARILDFLHVP